METTSITTTSNGTVLNPSSINFDTSQPGEKPSPILQQTVGAKIKTVKEKVTVRPNLYKNVFKVYADTIQSEIPGGKYCIPNQRVQKMIEHLYLK